MSGKTSGMEMMLNAWGFGDVIKAAKTLADAKTIEKIVQFADNLEVIDVRQINDRLAAIERKLGIEADPGSASSLSDLSPSEPSGESGTDQRSGRSRATRRRANSHDSGMSQQD